MSYWSFLFAFKIYHQLINVYHYPNSFFAGYIHIGDWTALHLKTVRHSSRVCTSQDLSSTSAGLLGACGCCRLLILFLLETNLFTYDNMIGSAKDWRVEFHQNDHPAKKTPDFGSKINIDQLLQPGRCSNQQAQPACEQLGPGISGWQAYVLWEQHQQQPVGTPVWRSIKNRHHFKCRYDSMMFDLRIRRIFKP